MEQQHNIFFRKKKNLIKKKFENIFQNFYKSIHFINININFCGQFQWTFLLQKDRKTERQKNRRQKNRKTEKQKDRKTYIDYIAARRS